MNKQGSAGGTPTNMVRLHRVLAAKPDKVYRAFTTADAMARWLPPNGFTCTVHQMDSKVGGTYRMSFTNFTTGKTHVFGGKYLDLVPDERSRPSSGTRGCELRNLQWLVPTGRPCVFPRYFARVSNQLANYQSFPL
jgi:hypothetical protein